MFPLEVLKVIICNVDEDDYLILRRVCRLFKSLVDEIKKINYESFKFNEMCRLDKVDEIKKVLNDNKNFKIRILDLVYMIKNDNCNILIEYKNRYKTNHLRCALNNHRLTSIGVRCLKICFEYCRIFRMSILNKSNNYLKFFCQSEEHADLVINHFKIVKDGHDDMYIKVLFEYCLDYGLENIQTKLYDLMRFHYILFPNLFHFNINLNLFRTIICLDSIEHIMNNLLVEMTKFIFRLLEFKPINYKEKIIDIIMVLKKSQIKLSNRVVKFYFRNKHVIEECINLKIIDLLKKPFDIAIKYLSIEDPLLSNFNKYAISSKVFMMSIKEQNIEVFNYMISLDVKIDSNSYEEAYKVKNYEIIEKLRLKHELSLNDDYLLCLKYDHERLNSIDRDLIIVNRDMYPYIHNDLTYDISKSDNLILRYLLIDFKIENCKKILKHPKFRRCDCTFLRYIKDVIEIDQDFALMLLNNCVFNQEQINDCFIDCVKKHNKIHYPLLTYARLDCRVYIEIAKNNPDIFKELYNKFIEKS